MAIRLYALLILLLCQVVAGTLLVDYNADRDDDPSKIGILNLESTRHVKVSKNTADLYIKSGVDWKGTKCAHVHHKEGFLRAEYHALKGNTEAGKAYYIGYEFALGAIPDGLLIWQWKEYEANHNGGANIPLSLEVRHGKLQFEYGPGKGIKRETIWTKAINTNTVHTIGLEILAKSADGHVRLWWDGNSATFTTTGTTTIHGNTFLGRSDPKFGAYVWAVIRALVEAAGLRTADRQDSSKGSCSPNIRVQTKPSCAKPVIGVDRRKKCTDNSIPVCGACKRLNLECIRESVRNVVPGAWADDQVVRQRRHNEGPKEENGGAHPTRITPAVAMSDDDNAPQRRHAMGYYITVLALHLTVSKEFNSFLSAFLPMALESIVLRDALFAFASGHLALVDQSYQRVAINASSTAIRNLATAISTPSADIFWHETTAAACLVLMTAEVGVGDCRSWYTHLKGAKDIISTAVGQANCQQVHGSEAFKHSSEGQWILRNFAYHDIIGSVTLRKRPLLDGSYLESISDVVDSYLGVGTRLLSYVSEITCLDDETTPRDHMGYSELQEMRTRFHSSTSSLESRLNNWKCPADTPGDLAAVAYAYRSAALILLYRLLRDRLGTTVFCSNDARSSRDRLIQIVQTKIRKQMDLTLTHVSEIPVGIGPESTLLFPLFLAGGEASEPSHIEQIRQRLLAILEQRHFRNVSRALEILEDLWALRQQDNGAGVDWSHILKAYGSEILLT
ncbi:hypothetical protein GQX73_g1741 [Xylaria multiplex]|uniref:Zn(2)-C6 fungal-type domain-containing protein n=1 Tax=Xylaria multiplex TaxID=323545 RepID=A0A7C8IWL9_9PEZI|nr:hypothetical protein GQX73_g1741 [Xylaria multiplex]